MAADRNWYTGNPPHIGWWNASIARRNNIWRWWNGTEWSMNTTSRSTAEYAEIMANQKALVSFEIEWSDYRPKQPS